MQQKSIHVKLIKCNLFQYIKVYTYLKYSTNTYKHYINISCSCSKDDYSTVVTMLTIAFSSKHWCS